MSDLDRIRGFLRAVRRRAFLEAMLAAGGLTFAVALLALLGMAVAAAHVGPASFWPTTTAVVLGGLGLAGLLAGSWGPWRRLRHDRGVARLVGVRQPSVQSDLLSAVELAEATALPPGTSQSITQAFYGSVRAALAPLDLRRLIPMRRPILAGLLGLVAAGALGGGAVFAPGTVRRGLDLLRRQPTRFEGAAVAFEPLIGDVRLVYTFPAYTGLPKRVVDGSTGDIVALKGTEVEWEAPILRRARQALILLGEQGEAGEHQVTLAEGKLRTRFVVRDNATFRVWLAPLFGRPVREHRAHRIVAEADQPPRVDIFGPADRLVLPTPRPIEVGYSALDDFGLGAVDLVWRVDDGPEQRQRLRNAAGKRADQGKTVFEPNWGTLAAGATIAYRVEALDRDDVSGSKTGSSRSLYVVIQNPREDLDEQLLREREVLDKLIDNLGERLGLQEAPPGTSKGPADLSGHLTTWQTLHESLESQVAALGRIIDDEKRGGAASKGLLQALSGIADRLGRRLREETDLLTALRAKADQGALAASVFGNIFDHGRKHVEDLEAAVLALDDLIGRQRLEDLAAMAKELTGAYKRLQDLLTRYEATKDEALRRQLEREMRDLRARIEELASKIAAVKARNEVPTEWQNMPDVQEAMKRADELSRALEKGDPTSLKKALSELGDALKDLQSMLQKNSDDFGGERFGPEQKALSEMMKKIGDLEGDERSLSDDGRRLSRELDAEAQERLEGRMEALLDEAQKKVDELRRKLATPMPREVGADEEDELRRAQDSAKQLRRLVPEKDWGEAKKEAERVASSLRRLNRGLQDQQAERERKGKKSEKGDDGKERKRSPAAEEFDRQMSEAGALAQELAQQLGELAPRADRMTPEQRQRAGEMSGRQGSLGERARDLAKEAGGKGAEVPGAERAAEELRSVAEQMGQAGQDFRSHQVREGSGKAEDAADRLAKLRDQMQETGKNGARGRRSREPVRIPGADDSQAPREWRQELLEAMRGKRPERFDDEVRRYYEELVK
jgi:predicted  nucleic acid-binding Zn-ribbon protein